MHLHFVGRVRTISREGHHMVTRKEDAMRKEKTVEALYSCDNGAIYCRDHLGITARMTGRDISGQPIQKIGPRDVEGLDWEPACETCGARLRRPVIVTKKMFADLPSCWDESTAEWRK